MNRSAILEHRHWAMEAAAFEAMLAENSVNVYAGKIEPPTVQMMSIENRFDRKDLGWMGIETIEGKAGLVAVIPVQGMLSSYWSWGGTNTSWLATQVEIATGNKAVIATILAGSTPGGPVGGIHSVGATIAECNAEKPVLTYVKGQWASAGLWLSCASSEVWLESAKSSGIGSLGVMSAIYSEHEGLKQKGIDVRVLRSKGAEDKYLTHPAEPINEMGVAEEQRVIDMMREEFLDMAMTGRKQLTTDPGGKMYWGKDGIKVGLADNVGSMNDVIKRAAYLGAKRARG
ncbi:MAG: hypothetical protein EAZ63_03680 [Runella slithyformis]|nr:MAG: hypothetical protein EAZ63_03680 [Runella slithyformis]